MTITQMLLEFIMVGNVESSIDIAFSVYTERGYK